MLQGPYLPTCLRYRVETLLRAPALGSSRVERAYRSLLQTRCRSSDFVNYRPGVSIRILTSTKYAKFACDVRNCCVARSIEMAETHVQFEGRVETSAQCVVEHRSSLTSKYGIRTRSYELDPPLVLVSL